MREKRPVCRHSRSFGSVFSRERKYVLLLTGRIERVKPYKEDDGSSRVRSLCSSTVAVVEEQNSPLG